MSQTIKAATSPQGESDFRLLLDAITDYAIYMLDPQGHVSSWNAGAQRFKGYRAEEIIGSHFSRFYTEKDKATDLPRRALHIAATEGKFEAEGWRVRKDGSEFWAHVVIDPIFAPDRSILGYAKITRDLTERRAAEEKLRHSEQQFRLLIESVTDYAIYMLDTEGHVSSWNAGAERIKGYRFDEIVGSHFSRFYTPEDVEAGMPARALETARRTGQFVAEGTRVRKDGSRFRASVVIDPVRDETGKLIGFAKITRDITEREEAQRELERAREALFQSQKMDAIGQLTGGVAHDFNNLLAAIMSSLELLERRLPPDPAYTRLIDNAMQGARRGATLIQRMLAFARRQALKPERIEVPVLVMGMTELLQRTLGPAWSLESSFPLRLSPVMADANQLEMALLNLVVNARDAMPDGGLITVSAREYELREAEVGNLPAGSYVKLAVVDTGIGMDAATLERATEPFFTTKGVGKGTGLGLSMIHGFAEQMHGTFLLKSEPGAGTTAELWLPVAKAEPRQDPEIELPPSDEPSVRPLDILAVDDDGLILMNTVALLEDMGHRVFEASSAEEALRIFRETPRIDLVVTDFAMPGTNGAELAGAIREERPGMPIILATGYGELPAEVDQPLVRLTKPFGAAELSQSVAEIMA